MPEAPRPYGEAKPKPATIFHFFGIFLLICGLGLLAAAGFSANEQWKVLRTWVPVQATVLKRNFSDRRSYGNTVTARRASYHLEWTFRYEANGQSMIALAGPGYDTSILSEAMEWDRRFPVNAERTIRYDPQSPTTISLAAPDFLTFRHAVWMGCWGIGLLGLALIAFQANRRMVAGSGLR